VAKGRVLVAMSGGVDSSVAAALLQEQGYEVVGVFMRSGVGVDESSSTACGSPSALPVLNKVAQATRRQGCCSAADARDARRVADMLGITFYAVDLAADFHRLMDYFVTEYQRGRTPNPCVMCNQWLKFGRLWDFARAIQADYVATGHYARIEYHPEDVRNPYRLMRAVDPRKDQSYVLYALPRELLSRILFPVGSYSKGQIREIARRWGLRVAEKPDSQEICFVPDGDHVAFVRRYAPGVDTSGEIVDVEYGVVGEHDGLERFTVGQRKGLKVALGARRYVLHLDPESRRVFIGPRDWLLGRRLRVRGVHWLAEPSGPELRCEVKIRYQHHPAAAWVRVPSSSELDIVEVEFDEPQSAITPGQAAVFYHGDQVLGGGWIESRLDGPFSLGTSGFAQEIPSSSPRPEPVTH
jgi:tRNA-specific 2-thiouridylase